MMAVQQGKRPARPSHDMYQPGDLTDEIWHLIEACWLEEPSSRPTASQIAKRLRSLPNRPVDRRPLDDFDTSFPSQFLHKELDSPFSSLTASTDYK